MKLLSTNLYILFVYILIFSSCKKYLDKKSDQSLTIPSSLSDLQAILDNETVNRAMSAINSSTDEYYISHTDWLTLDELNSKAHIWDPKTDDNEDWLFQYRSIFLVNTVLDNLKPALKQGQENNWNAIKGSALFIRAHCFYQVAQLYAKQFDANTSSSDLGIPLRLSSDFNKPVSRSSVQQTYDQIITDLDEASKLLPETSLHKTRPNKLAAYALLSRVYLQMGNYTKAKEYAESCLQLQGTLIDYNTLDPSSEAPIAIFNPEVIFYTKTDGPVNIYEWMSKVDTTVYHLFTENDLRKQIFFRDNGDGSVAFKGSYNGNIYSMFNGLATDEVYLILAESQARLGNKDAALKSLNDLLTSRFKQGLFTPVTAGTAEEALSLIIQERRKELLYRGLRWSDLKRLNKEAKFATTLKRVLDGTVYTLPPNDPRYALLIPEQAIRLSNLQQNDR